jgi:hypothetical protein
MQPSVEFGGIKCDSNGVCLPSRGLYQVTYGVALGGSSEQFMRGGQFQLNLCSANAGVCKVQGSTLSVASNRQLATMSLLIATQTDDSYLQIKNVSLDAYNRPAPVHLDASGGVNAFINVVKLH